MEWIAGIIGFLSAFLLGILPGATFGYYAAPPQERHAEILFVGDMMFDRSIRTAAEEHGGDYLFSCINETLASADLVVGNLEGPITSSSSRSVGSVIGTPDNFTFTFPTTTAELLARHNVRLVSIGNNHIMNFGLSGLEQTKQWLTKAGVAYFGDPDALESDRVARITVEGIPFSFVNWSDWTSDNTDITVAQIRTEAQSGRVVVAYSHWGEEYVPPIPRVRALAHQMADAGAAIVIGGHPHIVQERESYNGREIYYSLGNFIFDQYWNEDVSHGLALKVTFGPQGVRTIEELPVVLGRDRRTCLQ